jgi:hypothetical protein
MVDTNATLRDPSADTCPDYANLAAFQPIIDVLIRAEVRDDNGEVTEAGVTREEAIDSLCNAWKAEHQKAMEEWTDHTQALAQEEADVRAALEASEAAAAEAKRANQAKLEADELKKWPTLPDFTPGTAPPAKARPLMHKYAITECRARRDHALWYHGPEARAEAARKVHTGGTNVDDISLGGHLFWKGTAAKSTNAVPDRNLKWADMELAAQNWISMMEEMSYDPKYITALQRLLARLVVDTEHRMRPGAGDLLIVHYFASVKADFYGMIARTVAPYDISVIGEKRMDDLYHEILNARQVMPLLPPYWNR